MNAPKDGVLVSSEVVNATITESTAIQAKTLSIPVRVIYSLNASSQSLLARHRRKVEVVPVHDTEDGAHTSPPEIGKLLEFGKVSLKTCLGAVCTSSPELLADRSRDYSIYVVDPLETVYSSNNDPQTGSSAANNTRGGGVSIGVGLLSWHLLNDPIPLEGAGADDDDGYIIGRIVKDRGTEALEVVMSLRETAPQTQKAHVESLSSLGLSGCLTPGKLEYSKVPPVAASCPSSVPASPKACTSAGLPALPRQESGSKIVEENGKAPSARIGRPPGTTTHPEKRARRLAIQSHKLTLDKMQNIAKMQKGEPYDTNFVDKADHNAPIVTDADIARQQRVLEELESRPLIIDKPTNLLTTKPLRKRVSTSSTTTPSSKKLGSRQEQKSASSASTLASGSRLQNQVTSVGENLLEKSDPAPENKHGAELLLSLLTSVLSKVDSTSSAQPNTTAKGKAKEAPPIVDGSLATALKRLLPLLPGITHPQGYAGPITSTRGPVDLLQSSTTFGTPHYDVRQSFYARGSSPIVRPPSLFQTADETFNCSDRASTKLNELPRTKAPVRSDPPKVREDAYPVPGGGWARGKNLVPRTTATTMPLTSPLRQADQDATSSSKPSVTTRAPDKENMPPPQGGRGLKRCSSALKDGKDVSDTSSSPTNEKKRKRENKAANNSNGTKSTNVLDTKRMVMGPTSDNDCTTSGATGMTVAASSRIRHTTTAKPTPAQPILAGSEPDYLSGAMPLVAASTFPDIVLQSPQTPPRREIALDDDMNDSLFTPVPKPINRLDVAATSEDLLFSPSPQKVNIQHSAVANAVNVIDRRECSGSGSESHSVKTGWDLPPSSPPPPTSPISPSADISLGGDDHTTNASDGTIKKYDDDEPPERNTAFKCDDDTINAYNDSSMSFDFQSFGPTSDFDPLSDADFDFSILDQSLVEPTEHQGIELDVDELWKSLGPVIAQAQTDGAVDEQVSTLDQTSFDCFGMAESNAHKGQDSLDPIKLSEDLRALFGGCVV